MNYRSDIQILRGIAVLYVVLYHLNLSALQSGFLGVDVFFVISGFLMAVLYNADNKKEFFLRRARRLLPSFYTTIFATLAVSLIINSPMESRQVATQAIYGSVLLSNVGFWLQNSYFSNSEFKPLLHLWSLSVEIQFYLSIPLFVWFFAKTRLFFIACFLISIATCFIVLTISPKTSFYLMPFRVWEFLLGFGAAYYFTNNGASRYLRHSWLGTAGLILVLLIPILPVNGTSTNILVGHPGVTALVISIATALVLIFSIPNPIERNTLANVMVKLGDYSYSIYLVHFSVIVLYLSEPFSGTILTISSTSELIEILILIVLLSIALHLLVEKRKISSGIWRTTAVFSALTLMLAFSGPLVKNRLITDEERKIFNASQDRSVYRCGKLARVLNPTAITCSLSENPADTKENVLLVGDSHADAIKSTVTKVASRHGLGVYLTVHNNPLNSTGGPTSEELIAEAKLKKIGHMVVHFSPTGITADKVKDLVFLAEKNEISVSYLDPVPTWEEHIPKIMYRQVKGSDDSILQTNDDYLSANKILFENLSEIVNKNFSRISIVDYLCAPDCTYKSDNGSLYYFDAGHLTITGSEVIEDAIFESLLAESTR